MATFFGGLVIGLVNYWQILDPSLLLQEEYQTYFSIGWQKIFRMRMVRQQALLKRYIEIACEPVRKIEQVM
jgi:hypothetical protein